MTPQRKLSVSVENFGPVREGRFELSPLTIFIGPNNSGKSYMALLVYALSEALLGRVHGKYVRRFLRAELGADKNTIAAIRWIDTQALSPNARLSVRQMPDKLRTSLVKAMNKGLSALHQQIDEAVTDYFGCTSILDLVHSGDDPGPLSIRLNESERYDPLLQMSMSPDGTRPHVNVRFREPQSFRMRSSYRRQWLTGPWEYPPGTLDLLWTQVLRENGVSPDAYYLPAARSGILQGWQLFASFAVQALRQRVGLERIEVPPFTGVAGDFLQVLWERVMQRHPGARETVTERLRPVLQILEEGVFGGEVSLETKGAQRDLILYRSKRLRLPLNRASSMVAELAPLVLWIKYLLTPGDLLIIDEPEAHLHPANQRRVARALVRLVNAGVRVLCTTHSPTILHQVSNHVLAREVSSRRRSKLGFSAEDLLEKDDLGVYLFDVQEDGTHISAVPVEADFGIPEDEFVKVAEAIGDETYSLTSSPHK